MFEVAAIILVIVVIVVFRMRRPAAALARPRRVRNLAAGVRDCATWHYCLVVAVWSTYVAIDASFGIWDGGFQGRSLVIALIVMSIGCWLWAIREFFRQRAAVLDPQPIDPDSCCCSRL